jgi:hypothetical protein
LPFTHLPAEHVGTVAQPLDEAAQVIIQSVFVFGGLFQLIGETPGLVGCQRQ